MDLLCRYDWPGNVRELENLVYRSAVMAQGDTILIKDLPEELLQAIGFSPEDTESTEMEAKVTDVEELGAPFSDPMDKAYASLRREHDSNLLEQVERAVIARVLNEFDGKQSKAIELLGISRATLRKRIDQYGLEEAGS